MLGMDAAGRAHPHASMRLPAAACSTDDGDCLGCEDGVGGDTYECVASFHTRVGNNLRYDDCVSRCPWLAISNGECEDRCSFSRVRDTDKPHHAAECY